MKRENYKLILTIEDSSKIVNIIEYESSIRSEITKNFTLEEKKNLHSLSNKFISVGNAAKNIKFLYY